MFVDKATIRVRGGQGGDGVVSFRHEKFVDRGGPDGGDGGNGGDVVVQGSRNQNTLAAFRYHKELGADPGKAGSKQKKHGRSGKDLVVKVPVGTVIYNEQGLELADITENDQQVVIAKGGRGGFGNAHFISSRRQAPRIAEKGEPGEEFEVTFELKLIAEVGLIGLPNAGKSTLLSKLTNAKPEIADYAFTTIRPNLGVADIDKNRSLLLADIPGLIEGASKGKGLGDEFLRHVERTKVLIHLIDAYNDDTVKAYKTIRDELKAYKVDLSKKTEIVVLTKIEGLDAEMVEDELKSLRKVLKKATKLMAISAFSGQGLKALLYKTAEIADKHTETEQSVKERIKVIKLPDSDESWVIQKTDDGYIVSGRKIERFAQRTDFDNPEGVQRLRDIMRKMGIMHELERRRIKPDDQIIFGRNKVIGQLSY